MAAKFLAFIFIFSSVLAEAQTLPSCQYGVPPFGTPLWNDTSYIKFGNEYLDLNLDIPKMTLNEYVHAVVDAMKSLESQGKCTITPVDCTFGINHLFYDAVSDYNVFMFLSIPGGTFSCRNMPYDGGKTTCRGPKDTWIHGIFSTERTELEPTLNKVISALGFLESNRVCRPYGGPRKCSLRRQAVAGAAYYHTYVDNKYAGTFSGLADYYSELPAVFFDTGLCK